MTTALIADDEPLMLARLSAALNETWPELSIVAAAKNGEEAIAFFNSHKPAIAFLDIRMPGKTGLEVAAHIAGAAHIVFVTAYDEYAISAFENGAADYLLKPIDVNRLQVTVARLKKRLTSSPAAAPADLSALLHTLLTNAAPSAKLKWLRATVGNATRLINIEDVLFFQSDTKYTRIVLKDSEALIRTPLKDLLEQLDPDAFWQVHRGAIISVNAIDRAVREGPEKLVVHVKNSKETLNVSRQYFHLFREG